MGPQDPIQSLKVEPPQRSLMNSFFSEFFIFFYLFNFFVFFLNKIQKKPKKTVNKRNQYSALEIKNYDKEKIIITDSTENSNFIEVIPFLDCHRLLVLVKLYLSGAIAILKLPRKTSNELLNFGLFEDSFFRGLPIWLPPPLIFKEELIQ